MRSIEPVFGMPESSVVPAASFAKSTSAWYWLTSPLVSAVAWLCSRHQADCTCAPAAESPIVYGGAGLVGLGAGSSKRGPTLTIATPGPPPPGVSAVACPGCGARYAPAFGSHRP